MEVAMENEHQEDWETAFAFPLPRFVGGRLIWLQRYERKTYYYRPEIELRRLTPADPPLEPQR
jgi:hypothetical protein